MGRRLTLLSIINRCYLISTLLFFILTGCFLFFAFNFYLNEEMDEQLRTEQVHFTKAIQSMDTLEIASNLYQLGGMSLKRIPPSINRPPVLYDSLMYDEVEKEMIPFRLIRFSASTKKANYLVVLNDAKMETMDIVNSIFVSLMGVLGFLCILLVLLNSFLSKQVFSPLLKTIAAIKEWNVLDVALTFNHQPTRIQELDELNRSLTKMVERIQTDFLRMKAFSANAAHELQTPLSVIRSKLESLLQSNALTNENAQLINQALENTVRLSRLNQTLLLLTKIENRQFDQKQRISFAGVFAKYLENYTELVAQMGLTVRLEKTSDFVYEMSPVLTDVLVSNLLINAIKHNIPGGEVVIQLHENGFEINNTGNIPEVPTEQLFLRFQKGNHSPEHVGLGLALVKEIVDTSQLTITYVYHDNRHVLVVTDRF